jgi:hypothetical protein
MLDIGARGYGMLGIAVFHRERELARVGVHNAGVGLVGAVLHPCGPHLLIGAGRTLCWLQLPSLGERQRLQLAADLGRVRALAPVAGSDDVLVEAALGMARVTALGREQWTFAAGDVVTRWSMTSGHVLLQLDRSGEVHLDLTTGAACPP